MDADCRKNRLVQTSWTNHSWHVPLYVTSRGLTTSPVPYESRTFQIDFNFISHKLLIQTSSGDIREVALAARSVADFYEELFGRLAELNLDIKDKHHTQRITKLDSL